MIARLPASPGRRRSLALMVRGALMLLAPRLAGAAAPDDVLDALSQWAPTHSVTAYDSAAAVRTGLPWPELEDSGSVSLKNLKSGEQKLVPVGELIRTLGN